VEGRVCSEAKRPKALEDENARLKQLLVDAMLDNSAVKDLLGKMYDLPARARIEFVLTAAVRLNVSGLSRMDHCCGQAMMGPAGPAFGRAAQVPGTSQASVPDRR
jgi:hypothetical protein